ncbi:hypothetical protein [Aurantimonas sp. VKM B-3413]|uniref:hypothetical protein n=1 Tax=Aurantimonas sp. VKM B-3413 TaxID=2779401 RepID=UPI001E3C5A03|nr:hypothetical protein [Aurantimonas sp. VKM B-3413]MCB8837029.1 hypothetical protein [Aurantimonas sp. VKM B-3413]
MNRNAKLVFQFLALPIVLAIAEFQLLSLIGGGAILVLTFTDVEPLRVLTYSVMAFTAFMLATAFRHLGSNILATAVIIMGIVCAWKSEVLLSRVIPASESYRLTSDIPIALTQSLYQRTIYVSLVNNSSDYLEMAGIACHGFYADGSPVEGEWTRTVAGGHWQAPGERIVDAMAQEFYPDEAPRYDVSRTRCRVSFADFRRMAEAVPSFRFDDQSMRGHFLFHVTDDTPVTFTRLWFSCITGHGRREAIPTKPAYSADLDYKLVPGATLTLMASEFRSEMRDCRIYAVKTL